MKPTLRQIGRIVQTHGVMGEVKVAPETDDPQVFAELQTVFVGPEIGSASSFDIVSARFQSSRHGVTILLHLKGVDGREGANALKGLDVFADEADLPALGDDEFYYSDVIGLDVRNEEGEVIGRVADILEAPGQDKLLVSRPGAPSFMVPLVPAFIVDIDDECVIIRTIEGLVQ